VLFVSFVSDMRVSDYEPRAAAGFLIPKKNPTYLKLMKTLLENLEMT